MNICECGHGSDEHCDGLGRCAGESYDSEYGTFRCLCPAPTYLLTSITEEKK